MAEKSRTGSRTRVQDSLTSRNLSTALKAPPPKTNGSPTTSSAAPGSGTGKSTSSDQGK